MKLKKISVELNDVAPGVTHLTIRVFTDDVFVTESSSIEHDDFLSLFDVLWKHIGERLRTAILKER